MRIRVYVTTNTNFPRNDDSSCLLPFTCIEKYHTNAYEMPTLPNDRGVLVGKLRKLGRKEAPSLMKTFRFPFGIQIPRLEIRSQQCITSQSMYDELQRRFLLSGNLTELLS
jgi:hypothetical protein